MKKILNSIIIALSFLLLVLLALVKVNEVVHFVDVTNYEEIISFLKQYGTLIIVSALVFVNVIAKSLIRIIFVLLFLAVLVVYVLATSFPQIFGAV